MLHADLDAFYASVHQRDDPSLRGKPVIVGGGVVMAASYEARAFGIRAAMGGAKAHRMCPHAIVVEPDFAAYIEASRAVFEVFRDTTPLVEGISIDEAFLDVGGLLKLSGTPTEIATKLRADVRAKVGLAITVGVARTKFLAKVASAVGKPDGLLVVPPDGEIGFLHPLPVERLWGVGKVTADKLHDRGIATVGELALVPPEALIAMLGKASAHHLHALAHNLDPRPVTVGRRRSSIGSQHALNRKPRSSSEIDTLLVGIVDRVTRRLRKADRAGRTIVLSLRFDDFTRATRSHTLPRATAQTDTILDAARWLLASSEPLIADQGLTLIGLSIANLDDDDTLQMTLPFDSNADGAILDLALDGVRSKFGSAAITRAVLLGKNLDPQMPILPD
ncbi:MAG: DNA polymerase IV [Ilumatobacteraceae bacterium]